MQTYRTIAVLAAVTALACSGQKKEAPPMMNHMVVGEYIQPEDSFPKLRYLETGLVSLNDRCAVRKTRLNSKMPPVYVNGQPIGFC